MRGRVKEGQEWVITHGLGLCRATESRVALRMSNVAFLPPKNALALEHQPNTTQCSCVDGCICVVQLPARFCLHVCKKQEGGANKEGARPKACRPHA